MLVWPLRLLIYCRSIIFCFKSSDCFDSLFCGDDVSIDANISCQYQCGLRGASCSDSHQRCADCRNVDHGGRLLSRNSPIARDLPIFDSPESVKDLWELRLLPRCVPLGFGYHEETRADVCQRVFFRFRPVKRRPVRLAYEGLAGCAEVEVPPENPVLQDKLGDYFSGAVTQSDTLLGY